MSFADQFSEQLASKKNTYRAELKNVLQFQVIYLQRGAIGSKGYHLTECLHLPLGQVALEITMVYHI